MKNQKIPLRTCVVTREKYPKGELIRIVRTPEGEVIIDETGRANGRGAYIKKDIDVIKRASKPLKYHLDVLIPNEIIERLLALVNQE